MSARVGSLFSGYSGIEMGLGRVVDCEPAWFAEVDPAASRVLAHHWPDVPNHGDVTRIDWAAVEPIDILTGGVPCQDVSHAGKRAGMRAGTRTGLWSAMVDAIAELRPPLAVFENVRGILSAEADSDLEPCPGCVGDPDDGTVLRALGRVLGDLASLGYDARWYGLRAADVGACHGRFRVFVFAAPADTHSARFGEHGRAVAVRAERAPTERCGADPLMLFRTPTAQLAINGGSQHPDKRRAGGHGPTLADEVEHLLPTPCASEVGGTRDLDHCVASGSQLELSDVVRLLPTPRATRGGSATETVALLPTPTSRDHKGRNQRDDDTCLTGALLPTPRATDGTKGGPNQRGSSGDLMLPSVVHLLPTPTAMDSKASGGKVGGPNVTLPDATAREVRPWAQYEAAVRRHERALGRPAPAPTEPSRNGGRRLSPRFVEWLQMLPDGHVTDPRISLSRNEQLRMLGNGVVPPQCAAAFRQYLTDEAAEAAS